MDDFGTLPGALYARSFIRAYARCVGMNEEEAVAKYRKQAQIEEIPEPQFAPREYANEPSSRMLYVGGALLLLGVIGIGGMVTTYLERRQNNTTPAPPVANATNNTPLTSNAVPTNNAPVTTTSTTAPPITNPPVNPQPTANSENTSPNDPPPSVETLTLTLKTSGESWVRVYSDDAANGQIVIVKPGQTQEFKAQSKMKVTIGNLPAVQVAINGQPAKLPSTNGLVVANALISLENYRDYIAVAAKPNATPVAKPATAGIVAPPRSAVNPAGQPANAVNRGVVPTNSNPALPRPTVGTNATTPGTVNRIKPLPPTGAPKPTTPGATGSTIKPPVPKPETKPEDGEKPTPPAEKPPQPTETKPDDDGGY
jgi:cytoskeleton protein RodZ